MTAFVEIIGGLLLTLGSMLVLRAVIQADRPEPKGRVVSQKGRAA